MSQCVVCSRSLRNPSSVSRGTGPVCARNVQRFIDALQSQQGMTAWESWAQAQGARVGVDQMAVANARAQFLARIRRNQTIPISSGQLDTAVSAARGQVETLEYERFENGVLLVHSRSGSDYVITTNEAGHPEHCSCPDHQFRGRSCRHMESYSRLRELQRDQLASDQQTTMNSVPESPERLVEGSRLVNAPQILLNVSQAETEAEEERDRNLDAWAERHAHDGILISEDDRAWRLLREEAKTGMGEFEEVEVLDGIENTFGIELEVEGVDAGGLARSLFDEGLSVHDDELSYSANVASGSWAVKHDGSLSDEGAEIVSPILRDTPETWRKIQTITEILKDHGARADVSTGFHIHMGHQILDDRGYRWQRLGKYMLGYSREYLRMGAANKERGVTRHRGTHYTNPLRREHVVRLSRRDNAEDAARKIIGYTGHGSRYKMINTAKYIEHNVPTVEFRYPNGTVEASVVQRQVQLANATMMQAAYLRKHMPGADRLPSLFRGDEAVELSTNEEVRFRQYLDTLGSHRLRLIATQLWLRGKAA